MTDQTVEPVTQQQETVAKQKNPLRVEQGRNWLNITNVRNNKKRSHTQLDSRKQVIAFQDRVITINIKEAQHPLK